MGIEGRSGWDRRAEAPLPGESGREESKARGVAPGAVRPAPNHYDVLGVGPEASASEIRRAFRALALRIHPDKGAPAPGGRGRPPPSAAPGAPPGARAADGAGPVPAARADRAAQRASEDWYRAQDALRVLGSPRARARYDSELEAAREIAARSKARAAALARPLGPTHARVSWTAMEVEVERERREGAGREVGAEEEGTRSQGDVEVLTYQCKCGSPFRLPLDDALSARDAGELEVAVRCVNCSLLLEVELADPGSDEDGGHEEDDELGGSGAFQP